ncbi:DUF4402 domain-containing protein [Sphingomonas sp. LHG3406-1]|uniref:DUF4402 domain-containing protein n=1 Tax=Sphingomonas sp. LHG3406-1 TaxID=2804617 RepID=UPI0026102713|nr:DUF4402 domain-containing protein [Sphingomonas sp. LHG3406-1]
MKRPIMAALALGVLTTPSAAQQVSVTGAKPTASVNVMKPLQLTALRNLQFGTVLVGSFTGAQQVAITPSGRTCGSGGLTCSGTFSTAQYRVTGSNNQVALISSVSPTVTLTNGTGGTLVMTPSFPTSVTIDNSGNPGRLFEVGGSLSFTSTMPDGLYTGILDIQVAYQ